MSRILFDVNVPRPASRILVGHTVEFADRLGWRELTNGDLLTAAERAGFDVLLTADSNLRYQQNLAGRRIGIVVLSTNAWPIILRHAALLVEAVGSAASGTYREVDFPKPRRPAYPSTR